MNVKSYHPVLHWLAVATAVATFPLIFMGGLVTSHGVGLSVPDWPNSYHYNMFLFPPKFWVAGIFYEHTHRLMGTVVGFCSVLLVMCAYGSGRNATTRKWLWRCVWIALAAAAVATVVAMVRSLPPWLRSRLQMHEAQGAATLVAVALTLFCATLFRNPEERRWVRRLSWGVLGFVIFQGVLGGLRVVMLKLNLAIVHACIAQAFFCLATLMVVVTSKWWLNNAGHEGTEARRHGAGSGLIRFAVIAWLVIYAQLIVGATMRHYNAGLAIPDVPLAFGKLVPPTNLSDLRAAQERVIPADDLWYLDDVSVSQVWLAYGHRIGAVLVSVVLIWLCVRIFHRHRVNGLVIPAVILLMLLAAQVTLGLLTVIYKKPADIASMHVAVGALVLATTFVLAVRSMRVFVVVRRRKVRGFEPVMPRTALSGVS